MTPVQVCYVANSLGSGHWQFGDECTSSERVTIRLERYLPDGYSLHIAKSRIACLYPLNRGAQQWREATARLRLGGYTAEQKQVLDDWDRERDEQRCPECDRRYGDCECEVSADDERGWHTRDDT